MHIPEIDLNGATTCELHIRHKSCIKATHKETECFKWEMWQNKYLKLREEEKMKIDLEIEYIKSA